MNRSKLLLWILLASSFLLNPALSGMDARAAMGQSIRTTGPVDITARELKYNREQNIYTAEGDVVMVEGNRRLTADFVLFNDTTKDAFAEGHVVFQDQEDEVRAERISLNIVTNRGTIENGRVFVKKGNFFLTGNEIEKTGESSYKVHDGVFTTCGFDRPAWTFSAKDVDLTVEGYATARNATFSILGQKVLYMPWGIFPVKNERQSGFLLPEIQTSSRDGAIFRDAYFWAIDKDKDATFFFDWIQDRGVKPGLEYRYSLTETTRGAWYGSIIDDRKFGHTRYQITGQHEQAFGDALFKADINHVSDFNYLQDLGLTTNERSQNSLRSVAFIEKPLARSLLTGQAAYFQDLSQKNNDGTIQYLPSASYFTEYFSILKQRVYADLAADATNFTTDNGDRFTRLTASPTLRVPYSLSGLNFLFSGGLVEKAYSVDQRSSGTSDNTPHHELIAVQGEMNASFLKNSHTTLFDLGQVQSVIMPRIQYSYLKNMQSFANIPTIDPSDRTNDANIITYSLNHYFNAVSNGQVREIALLEIQQSYGLSRNLEPQPTLYYGSGSRLSDIHVRLTAYPKSNVWFSSDSAFNIHGEGFTTMTNSAHYALPPVFEIDLSHSYSKTFLKPETEQMGRTTANEVWFNTMTRWNAFDLRYQLRYSFVDASWIDTLAALTYHPSCWGVTLTLTKTRRPEDTSVNLSFNLQGIAQSIGGR
jgi:LPS-assembly protein